MKKIILLTGNELRHNYFKKFMSSQKEIKVIATYCESDKGSIVKKVNIQQDNNLRKKHLEERNKSEIQFFKNYCEESLDNSNSIFINRGDINSEKNVKEIIALNPDLIISYGCSIIRSRLLEVFENKFINIHLGISPYYRGSGTNFWPFVENELSAIGSTFMHIDSGIDTGDIIHQIRARIKKNDSIHSIGNRLIKDSSAECVKLIENFEKLKRYKKNNLTGRLYRNKDFSEECIKKAYHNLDQKIENYLVKKNILDEKFPIIDTFE
ncbi:formyl transferase [Flavobacteriaceae bacterium]|nr:formyl transferase [Flavobacteriaceae bacterium]